MRPTSSWPLRATRSGQHAPDPPQRSVRVHAPSGRRCGGTRWQRRLVRTGRVGEHREVVVERRHLSQTGAMTGSRTSGRRTGDLALVLAALCFGGTFVVVQDAIERRRARAVPRRAVLLGALVPVAVGAAAARDPPASCRDGVARRRRPPRRLPAPDHRAAVHRPGHLRLHHLPAGGVRAPDRPRPPPAPPPPRSPWAPSSWPSVASCCSPTPGAVARPPGSGRGRSSPSAARSPTRSTSSSSARPPTGTTPSASPRSRWAVVGLACLGPGAVDGRLRLPRRGPGRGRGHGRGRHGRGVRPPDRRPADGATRRGPRCSSSSSPCSPP